MYKWIAVNNNKKWQTPSKNRKIWKLLLLNSEDSYTETEIWLRFFKAIRPVENQCTSIHINHNNNSRRLYLKIKVAFIPFRALKKTQIYIKIIGSKNTILSSFKGRTTLLNKNFGFKRKWSGEFQSRANSKLYIHYIKLETCS